MALLTFKGGIHPPENKKLTEEKNFENLSIPSKITVPLQQHIGKPAIPTVSVGDTVKEGQLIAAADGFVSAKIHTPVPGNVVKIDSFETHTSRNGQCIVIETRGNIGNQFNESNDNWNDLSSTDLIKKIADAGIVGMGGAAFPTHVKLSPPKDKVIKYLIINAAECEPYLTVDDNLVQTYAKQIIEGTKIVKKILNVDKAIIGLENNTKHAYKLLKDEINSNDGIEVKLVKTKYPQGSEKQLIQVLTSREVPSSKLPMDAGCVVQNVGTIFAIYEAIVKNKPLVERYITVTGSAIKRPGNYKVKIGTLISEIVEECGGFTKEPSKIIMGGPMCGLALSSLNIPIVKGTSGLLFLTEKETSIKDYGACIRCGKCVTACPINLLPYELANAAEFTRFDLTENLNPLDCIMCGSCAYVCPAKRPINHFIKIAQQELRNKK